MEKKVLPKLEHREDTFKIIIPEYVENKIRFLCNKIWTLEWSGVLFYKVEGGFNDKSLTIRCVDIYPMDIGTAGTTEFKVTPDISFYMTDHPELLEVGIYQGLIHSHNTMSSFFSGTDTATLQSEGMDMAHFVSLIVNNAGVYTAGITRRGKCIQKIKEKLVFQSWDEYTQEIEDTFEVEEDILEWFNLDVIIQKPDIFESEITERLEEIKKAQEEVKKVSYGKYNTESTYHPTTRYNSISNYGVNPDYNSYKSDLDDTYNYYGDHVDSNKTSIKEVKNTQAITKDSSQELPFFPLEEGEMPYGIVTINDKILKALVRQIITSSVIIPNESVIDIDKWSKGMTSLYNKRFGTEQNFKYFAQSYVDYLVNYTIDEDALIALEGDEDALVALIAYDLTRELSKLPKNKWLDLYIKYLNDYII